MYKYLIFILFSFSLSAQIIPPVEELPEEEETVELEKPKSPWKEKFHYGGNIWVGFWGTLYLEATPMVGWDISEKGTVAGVGASILYYGADKMYGGGLSVGPKVFVRQAIWRTVFAHAEYELMNSSPYNFYDVDPTTITGLNPKNKWGGTGYIGAGFYQNGMRTQGGGFISVLYNLNAPNSGYINRQSIGDGRFVLRIGFFI
jgi:hypothetical protein